MNRNCISNSLKKRIMNHNVPDEKVLDKKHRRWKDLMLGYVKPRTKEEKEMMKEIESKKGVPYIPSEW